MQSTWGVQCNARMPNRRVLSCAIHAREATAGAVCHFLRLKADYDDMVRQRLVFQLSLTFFSKSSESNDSRGQVGWATRM